MPSSIDKTEFRRIYKQIMGSASTKADLGQLYTIISAAGRTILQSHLVALWPGDKQVVSLDRAYEIYGQLEGYEVTAEDVAKIMHANISIEQILAAKPENYLVDAAAVEACLRSYVGSQENGKISIAKFLNDVEQRKRDTVEKLLARKDDEMSLLSSSRSTVLTEERMNQVGLEEDSCAVSSNGYLTVSPALVVTRFTISTTPNEFSGEIHLKINRNSDMSPDRFANDLFAVVTSAEDEPIGITKRIVDEDRFTTEAIEITDGATVTIVCLGTTIEHTPSPNDEKPPVELIQNGTKLTKRYKVTLMNLFDAFDWNCDGYLDLQEMNFYTILSGDEEGVKTEEWQMLHAEFDHHDGMMNMQGFIQMHEAEASSAAEDESTVTDIWSSLERLGYNKQLRLLHGCPFSIHIHPAQGEQISVKVTTELKFMGKEDKNRILNLLYNMSTQTETLGVRIFRTQYYGMMIAHHSEELKGRVFRLSIETEHNVKWNFVCGMKDISFDEVDSDYLLIVSYAATESEHSAIFKLVDDNNKQD